MTQQETIVGRIFLRIKNNRFAASLIVFGTIVVAIASLTGAVTALLDTFRGQRPEDARAELERLSLEYTPAVFVDSAERGELHAIELFLTAGIDPNAANSYGQTALMWAAVGGHTKMVQALLDHEGIDLNAEDDNGETALSWVAYAGDPDMVRMLLARGPAPQVVVSGFVAAAEGGHSELLRPFIEWGVDLDSALNEALLSAARSPHHIATDQALSETVTRLLDLGANVNFRSHDTWTPLLCAVESGYGTVARTLLDNGADVNARCETCGYLDDGWGALMMAISHDSKLVDTLLARGADVNMKTNEGRTALMQAAGRGEVFLVRKLLDKGADVNANRSDGRTALMRAAEGGSPDVVRTLLQNGAHVDARDSRGRTALDWALSEPGESGVEIAGLLKGAASAGAN